MKKNIECVYAGMPPRRNPTPESTSTATTPISTDSEDLLTYIGNFDSNDLVLPTGNRIPKDLPPVFETPGFSLDDFMNIDALAPYGGASYVRELVPPDHEPPAWCTWSRGDVSLTVLYESSLATSDFMSPWLNERPYAQHNANLVIQSLRSLPTMMLRTETFPWCVHRYSYNTPDGGLPETISTCMSVAQLFTMRTPETKGFLWATMRNEYRRFEAEVGDS